MNVRTRFNNTYGEKPIFGGVYTDKPVDKMVDEVKRFTENGINVYIEALRFRNDVDFRQKDFNVISKVLDTVLASHKDEKGVGKIGINFLFDHSTSLSLTEGYRLPFMINDAFGGDFLPTQHCDKRHTFAFPAFSVSGVDLFAGITPGYLINETPDEKLDDIMKSVNFFSNAVVVGNSSREEMLEQIIRYKESGLVTKPMIAAQGVKVDTLYGILKVADAAIIGSGFREDGNVSLEKIKQIKEIQQEAIKKYSQ